MRRLGDDLVNAPWSNSWRHECLNGRSPGRRTLAGLIEYATGSIAEPFRSSVQHLGDDVLTHDEQVAFVTRETPVVAREPGAVRSRTGESREGVNSTSDGRADMPLRVSDALPIERTQMNRDAFSAEFSALTEDEQVMTVGGDGYLAGLIGAGIGYAVGVVINAVILVSKAANGQEIYYTPTTGCF